jgi:hypothetical protein
LERLTCRELVVDQVWARNKQKALDPDEALALAHAELQNFRTARSSPAA